MSESCENCRFWHMESMINNIVQSSGGKSNGKCLRYPPQHVILATIKGLANIITFPSTESDQWCGEYQRFEEEPVPELPKPKLLE